MKIKFDKRKDEIEIDQSPILIGQAKQNILKVEKIALKWTENLIHNNHVIAEERLNITKNRNIASFKQRKWLAREAFFMPEESIEVNILPKIRY